MGPPVQDFASLLVMPMSLPNFAFTWPLARHLKPSASSTKQQQQRDQEGLLADAICFFPAAVTQLTARCCLAWTAQAHHQASCS